MRIFAAMALLAMAAGTAQAQTSASGEHWVGSWATSEQIPEPGNVLPPASLHDATLRQIVHLSIGGNAMRLRFSNAFGTQPLHLSAVHVARALPDGAIDAPSDHALSFDGAPDVTIPAGADYYSDPVAFAAAPFADIAISIHYDDAPAQQTGHPGSRATSYLVPGDAVSAAVLNNPTKIEHWYQIQAVEMAAPDAQAVVALGDSITDGHGSTVNGNDRWPDVMAQKLAARNIGVLNEGIGGNHLLTDGLGPNALARFDRDVASHPNAHKLIVLEGINDIGGLAREAPMPAAAHMALVQRIIAAFKQIVLRAHAQDMTVAGATILPFAESDYYHPDAATEADRQTVNAWIRAAGAFDSVIDLDALTRDPARPDHLLAAYDSGDRLHPGPQGYRAMGEAVAAALFPQKRPPGLLPKGKPRAAKSAKKAPVKKAMKK